MKYSRAQLDQMLAPIALYPDQLLLALLMASTFPQQVIDAGQWLQAPDNASLKGDALATALQPLPWDPSVKSLVAFPQLVTMMNAHLEWTEALGAAFANQQVAVMARVQFLRERAARAGRLASTKHVVVHRREGEITIEPAAPDRIYVPVYNPAEVYGVWPDQGAPPVYIPPPPNFYSGPIGAAIGFTAGFAVARPLWGWGRPDWRRHEVVIDRRRYERITNTTNITNNNIVIQNNTWHRTAPVAAVPAGRRPQSPGAVANAPRPRGTVASTAVVLPKPAPAAHPASPPASTAVTRPPARKQPVTIAHPPTAAHPPTRQHPAAVAHPPAAHPPARQHPATVAHPPAAHPREGKHPATVAHPPAAHPQAGKHPATVAHPPAAHPQAGKHPATVAHPPAAHPQAGQRPATIAHPPAAHQRAGQRPATVAHPPAAARPPAGQHPAAVVRTPAAHPPAGQHPAAVTQRPAVPKSVQPAVPHPAVAPHAARPHSAKPAKKSPAMPGEEQEKH